MSTSTQRNISMNPIHAIVTPFVAQYLTPLRAIVEVSPEVAKQLLVFNTRNRHARTAVVDAYRRQMLAGEWSEMLPPIAFDAETQVLVDGQHRLMAIASLPEDVAIRIEIRWDANDHYRNTIDTGIGRKAADTLVLNGMVNGTHKASAARELLARQTNRVCARILPAEILSFVLQHEAEIGSAVLSAQRIYHCIGFSPQIMSASLVEFSRQNPEKALEFIELLVQGDTPGSVITLFRERAMKQQRGMTAAQKRVLLDSAWQKWLKGRKGSPRTHRRATRQQGTAADPLI